MTIVASSLAAAGRVSSAPGRIVPVLPPVHCAMFAVDIVAFGSRRDGDVQLHLREVMYRITRDACWAAGIPWELCHHEDRGDGLVLIAPAAAGAEALFDPLVAHMRAGLRRHNKLANATARFRVRMAAHAGYVQLDTQGASGNAVVHLFRLLNAPAFKTALADVGVDFALLASDYLYQEVIRYGPGLLDPNSYQPLTIANKETRGAAWLWLPLPTTAERPPHPLNLSHEEVQVAMLMASGWSRKRIAHQLNLTPNTVDERIRRVFAELCLTTSNPAEIAAAFAARRDQRERQTPDPAGGGQGGISHQPDSAADPTLTAQLAR